MDWIVYPQNVYIEALNSIPHHVMVFGHRSSREVIKMKWHLKGEVLIPQRWCPCNRKKRHQSLYVHMRRGKARWDEGRQPSAGRRRAFTGSHICQPLGSGLLAPRTVTKGNAYCSSRPVCIFSHGSPSWLIQLGMQEWFNVRQYIQINHHINRSKVYYDKSIKNKKLIKVYILFTEKNIRRLGI